MTDTAAHADVVLPATTQLEHLDVIFSWGHHYVTLNRPAIEPLGEAKPNTEIFRLLAARLGLDDPCFGESDEELVEAVLADGARPRDRSTGSRERGWAKVDLGQGRAPHAEGGLRHARRASSHLRRSPSTSPPAEVADAELAAALPARADHAQDPPLPELDVREPGAPARRAAEAVRGRAPRRRRAARGSPTRARVYNDRGSFVADVQVSDETRPGVVVAPMGWWSGDYEGGVGAQATTPQLLTEMRRSADVQRQPRRARAGLAADELGRGGGFAVALGVVGKRKGLAVEALEELLPRQAALMRPRRTRRQAVRGRRRLRRAPGTPHAPRPSAGSRRGQP